MILKKWAFSLLIITFFSVSGIAQEQKKALERVKPLPLKELRNPNGPSYVPFPYPATEVEIIADLKHAIKLFTAHKEKQFGTDIILVKLLDEDSGVYIAGIEKVTNKTILVPDEFLFLITLNDNEGNAIARVSLMASGLYSGSTTISDSQKKLSGPSMNRPDALKEISAFISRSEVKKMERIFMANKLAMYPFAPTWEIETFDNRKYFLDVLGRFYKLRNEIGEVKSKGLSTGQFNASINELIVYDSLFDQIMFLDRLK